VFVVGPIKRMIEMDFSLRFSFHPNEEKGWMAVNSLLFLHVCTQSKIQKRIDLGGWTDRRRARTDAHDWIHTYIMFHPIRTKSGARLSLMCCFKAASRLGHFTRTRKGIIYSCGFWHLESAMSSLCPKFSPVLSSDWMEEDGLYSEFYGIVYSGVVDRWF
jgi:hypothetical protein